MSDLVNPQDEISVNKSLTPPNGMRPVARVTPADSQQSDTTGPGHFDVFQYVLGDQSFAMIATYSLVILVALGYVPGLGL